MVRSVAANLMRPGLRFTDTAQYQQLQCHTAIGKQAVSFGGRMHGTLYLYCCKTYLTVLTVQKTAKKVLFLHPFL